MSRFKARKEGKQQPAWEIPEGRVQKKIVVASLEERSKKRQDKIKEKTSLKRKDQRTDKVRSKTSLMREHQRKKNLNEERSKLCKFTPLRNHETWPLQFAHAAKSGDSRREVDEI